MKNRISVMQEVYHTARGTIQLHSFWLVEHVDTMDGVRSRITGHTFPSIELAKEELVRLGYEIR